MGLSERNGSCDFAKKSFSSSSKKKNNTRCQRENEICSLMSGGAQKESMRLQINKMGPNRKTKTKAAVVFPELEEDDCDIDKQFGQEICSDQDESMWLSSDCSSPSSFFNNYRFSSSCQLSLDEWLVSWLSILRNSYLFLGRGIPFFDGSSINLFEDASLVLERTSLDAERNSREGLEEEEVVAWLLSSTRKDVINSSVACSETAESISRQSSEDSTSSEYFSIPISTHLDSPAKKWDLDRLNLWVSLVNLDGEDSKWISDTESELDSFESDFPSPPFRSSWGSEVRSSDSSVSSFSEISHEKSQYDLSSEPSDTADLEDLNSDDPLFWPFERKFDWSSVDCFCMSPRKDIDKVEIPVGNSPKVIGLRLHDRRMNLKEGCKRRLVFSSTTTTASKIVERKQRNDNKGIKRINTPPSRLRKSMSISMKIVPLDMKDDIIEPPGEIAPTEKSIGIYGDFLEEEDFESKIELPIESLLGLNEFDGHEGVDLEFNKDDFSLDESL